MNFDDEKSLFEVFPIRNESEEDLNYNCWIKRGTYFKLKHYKTGFYVSSDFETEENEEIKEVTLEIKGKSS